MTLVSCIVEGHGEVAAIPVLLRRIARWRSPDVQIEIQRPIKVHRNRFLNRDAEFARHLELASHKCGDDGWVLVVLDADDDCPVSLGTSILDRARRVIPHRALSVVLPTREFEAWFIGAAKSLNGHRGLTIEEADLVADPEVPRNAKGWISERMADRSYGETTDQPAFAAMMDMEEALDRCRSFRKLCDEWDRKFGV